MMGLVEPMNFAGVLRKRDGISLIEVLAALVVFTIGILAVVRLFPGGFSSIKQTENSTLAHVLARAETERLKGLAANLPAGILGWNVDGTPLTDVDPEDLGVLAGLPGTVDPHYYSDVNKFRHIYGEVTPIPVPSPNTWDQGSVYVLMFSPIAWDDPSDMKVYSGPMRRLAIHRLRNASLYSVDYDAGIVYVYPVDYPREFVIKYSYWEGQGQANNPRLVAVLSQTVSIPANVASADIPGPQGTPVSGEPGYLGIEHRSDSLHRAFRLLQDADLWSTNDPYEYKITNTVAGVLAFNPYGHGYQEVTSRGTVPLTAHIDYDVLDWHVIREERKIPEYATAAGDPDLDVKLTLRFIKERGVTQEINGDVFNGLAAMLTYSVIAIDLETGDVLTDEDWALDGSGPAFTVDFKEGILRFNPFYAGHTFRIYYRADGDWAVQAYKAYDVFSQSYVQGALDYRQYFLSDNGKLIFPKCSNGYSVGVDFRFRENGQANGTPDRFLTGQTLHIQQDQATLTYGVDLRKLLDEAGYPDATITSVDKVYGVTMGIRVIWRDGGSGFRAGKWKSANVQTYLTRTE